VALDWELVTIFHHESELLSAVAVEGGGESEQIRCHVHVESCDSLDENAQKLPTLDRVERVFDIKLERCMVGIRVALKLRE